jgi:hypothetical protein
MKPTIVIPFWGNHPAYRRWLEEWVRRYEALKIDLPVLIASDEVIDADLVPQIDRLLVGTARWADLVDPRYPYDRKGAIVCAAILALQDCPVFVLDADAYLVGDPSPILQRFLTCGIAMPADEGAFGKPYEPPFEIAERRCAGVILFGSVTCDRNELVRDYRTFYNVLLQQMECGKFREERRLLEQHAWTMVADGWNGPLLPRELNWPVCFKSSGDNPRAVIHHHIGRKKWVGQEAPTPGLLNDGQLRKLGVPNEAEVCREIIRSTMEVES